MALTAKQFWYKQTSTWRRLAMSRRHMTRDRLADRAAMRELIEASKLPDGTIAVVSGGRDCDMATYEGLHHLPASVMAMVRFRQNMWDGAEGPVYAYIVTPDEAAAYVQPRSRDLALEAFEDGHQHCVYA